MNSLELAKIIHQTLKPLGYKKQSATWNIVSSEVVGVLNIQKSQWGEQFYINIGLLPVSQVNTKFVTNKDCFMKISYRLDELFNDQNIPSVIDFEKTGEKLGIESIKNLLDKYIIPFFEKNNSINGIIESHKQGIFIHRYSQEYLRNSGYIV